MKLSEELIEIVEHEARGAIDTLRHASAFGHIERVLTDASSRIVTLESENARLAARLRVIAEALRELSPGPHPGPMNAEDYVPLIAARVAELERIVTDLNPEANLLALYDMGVEAELQTEALNRELKEQVESLQAQLAWTPVSAGLPTEPGVYVFSNPGDEFIVAGLSGAGSWALRGERLELWELHYWQCYRRIELPKGGES